MVNNRITAAQWEQDVRHIELELAAHQPSLAYNPGDVVCILPRNPSDAVAQMAERLGVQLDSMVDFIASNNEMHHQATPSMCCATD
jgi:sulfite reductase alpha subunit-like flavoprotein